MYLSNLFIENFRIFGSVADGEHLQIKLRPGLNVLAGENDSGKTAIIDALRHILWTTSFEYHRLTEDDFHVSGEDRATSLRISYQFSDLSIPEAARFLEWLSVDEQCAPILKVSLRATRMDDSHTGARARRQVAVTVRSGKNGDGPAIEGDIREFLRATYLRPLRDAERELAAGKGSRLSQVLQSHPGFQDQDTDDFDQTNPEIAPKTLVGIMRHAEHRIANNDVITAARRQLNEQYLDWFSIADETLSGSIGVARSTELRQILEKLELRLDPPADLDLPTPRGLGFNNVLFMATELLLLGEAATGVVPLLLIEEPEAHLHPQMQLRLIDFLDDTCARRDSPVQVLLTTHSPNLSSSVDLECVTLMNQGKAFSLASDCTKLDRSDYRFLRRFLDVTKANLFFAKGVILVEGDAENILLPLLAELLDRPFSKNGVSVVNVGHVGLFRYARIFQRQDETETPRHLRAQYGECKEASDMLLAGILEFLYLADATDSSGQRFTKTRLTDALAVGEEDSLVRLKTVIARLILADIPDDSDGWQTVVDELTAVLSPLLPEGIPNDVKHFLEWVDTPSHPLNGEERQASTEPNVYQHNGPTGTINIELSTIHSVKGQTHTATLVLETFDRTHDLKKVLNFLKGGNVGKNPPVKHMKRVFVAMTRPRELLCLAMRSDHLSPKDVTALTGRGWTICDLTDGH